MLLQNLKPCTHVDALRVFIVCLFVSHTSGSLDEPFCLDENVCVCVLPIKTLRFICMMPTVCSARASACPEKNISGVFFMNAMYEHRFRKSEMLANLHLK